MKKALLTIGVAVSLNATSIIDIEMLQYEEQLTYCKNLKKPQKIEISESILNPLKPALFIGHFTTKDKNFYNLINTFKDYDIFVRGKIHNRKVGDAVYLVNIEKNNLEFTKKQLLLRNIKFKEISTPTKKYYSKINDGESEFIPMRF